MLIATAPSKVINTIIQDNKFEFFPMIFYCTKTLITVKTPMKKTKHLGLFLSLPITSSKICPSDVQKRQKSHGPNDFGEKTEESMLLRYISGVSL